VTVARTHLQADPTWCGKLIELGDGRAVVALDTAKAMTVDAHGLVHGGFVFGLADYAAMLAVNDPFVVLGSARSRFIRPVRLGERVVANAVVTARDGRKQEVEVDAAVGGTRVFEGVFTCFVLERHVLDRSGSKNDD